MIATELAWKNTDSVSPPCMVAKGRAGATSARFPDAYGCQSGGGRAEKLTRIVECGEAVD